MGLIFDSPSFTMKPRTLTPMLWTTELEETISFYTDILGFTCGERNDEWGWAALYNGEVEIMLARPSENVPFEKPNFTGSFYFQVYDVDTLWGELKHKCEVEYPLENFDWEMREFAIRDNNGYILQFGQDIKELN